MSTPYREGCALPLLERLRVAAPSRADWEAMAGDDEVRFCEQCQKNVYNLSAMARPEADEFVREHTQGACIRLYRRADGTVITADCPSGLRRRRDRRRLAVVGGTAIVAGTVLAIAAPWRKLTPDRRIAPTAHSAAKHGVVMGDIGGLPPSEPWPDSLPNAPPAAGFDQENAVKDSARRR